MEEKYPSLGHAVAYMVVVIPLSVFGVLANACYLVWQVKDNRLVCSFTVCLGNLALCSLLVALVMPLVNIILLFDHNVTLCAIQRISTSFLELEETVLLLGITFDRVYFLLADLPRYRRFANVRRTFYWAVATWVIVILLTVFDWSFNWASLRTDDAFKCKVLRPHAIASLPILFDVLILCMTALTIKRCFKTQPNVQNSSWYLCQGVSNAPTETEISPVQLLGREAAAMNVGYDIAESSTLKLCSSSSPCSFQTSTSHFKEANKSRDAGPEKDAVCKEGDVDMKKKKLNSQTSRQHAQRTAYNFLHRNNSLSPHQRQNSTSRSLCKALEEAASGSDTWYAHPKIKSLLPPFLSRTLPKGYKVRTIAAHQLGVLLFVHLVFGLPASICKFMATYKAEWRPTITSFVQWMDLLSNLQACLFPLVYLLYSDRLRGHVLILQKKLRCCHRHRRVHSSIHG